MINLANKSFKNNLTGEIVTVIDSFEDIAILENKNKAVVSQLLNPNLYTEEIDPNSFFNNQGAYNILAEKIKNIPQDQIRYDESSGEIAVNLDGNFVSSTPQSNMDESAVIVSSIEDEKAELAKKYGINNTNNNDSIIKQNDAFAKLLGEEGIVDLPRYEGDEVQRVEVQRNESGDASGTININGLNKQVYNKEYIQPIQDDPILRMFKGVKRVLDFDVTIDITNKIPRLDFIEMMEDSYEVSIIDFLSEEFTNNIIRNPDVIKDMIKDKINRMVYGEDYAKIEEIIVPTVKTKAVRKTTPKVVKEDVEKPKPKRTPRLKKEEIK